MQIICNMPFKRITVIRHAVDGGCLGFTADHRRRTCRQFVCSVPSSSLPKSSRQFDYSSSFHLGPDQLSRCTLDGKAQTRYQPILALFFLIASLPKYFCLVFAALPFSYFLREAISILQGTGRSISHQVSTQLSSFPLLQCSASRL